MESFEFFDYGMCLPASLEKSAKCRKQSTEQSCVSFRVDSDVGLGVCFLVDLRPAYARSAHE